MVEILFVEFKMPTIGLHTLAVIKHWWQCSGGMKLT